MLTTAYQDILTRVERLSPAEQLQLMEQLAALLRHRVAPQSRHSIMELQGLGKEIWGDIDAQPYVHQERDSWDG